MRRLLRWFDDEIAGLESAIVSGRCESHERYLMQCEKIRVLREVKENVLKFLGENADSEEEL